MDYLQEFEFVREAGFIDTYSSIIAAMEDYDTDSEVCCMKYRNVLEAILEDILNILNLTESQDSSNYDTISFIQKNLPCREHFEPMINELSVFRKLGNKYLHRRFIKLRNPLKDRVTGYCALRNICRYMVERQEYTRQKTQCRNTYNSVSTEHRVAPVKSQTQTRVHHVAPVQKSNGKLKKSNGKLKKSLTVLSYVLNPVGVTLYSLFRKSKK